VTVSAHEIVAVDPVLDPADEAAVRELCTHFGRYRTYGELEPIEIPEGPGLAQRHDSVMNFLRSGGLEAARERVGTLAARTSYFREEYAYAGELFTPAIAPFLHSERLAAAARVVHGRPVIEPQIAYANLMVPGQELAVHTDVPEFRGVSRKTVPQWLLVVMHHSGLFDPWRLHIATGVAWFSDLDGGALAYWPDGPDGALVLHPIRGNTALVLDTDSVFHGVDRVGAAETEPFALKPGNVLEHDGERWVLHPDAGSDEVLAAYGWDEIRFSVSWKAYCFADEAERDAWRTHADDLDLDVILAELVTDLRARGLLTVDELSERDLALMLIDTYEHKVGPRNGARVVAKAWSNPAFKQALLEDASKAVRTLGHESRVGDHLVAIENTPAQHNMIVCTLCSCYPWEMLGLPPVWYKSAPYRSRAVKDPRGVLADFGLTLPATTEIRVWDSTAETRFLVLPMRPAGTEGWSEEQLAQLVTRDSMIGTGLPKSPSEAA